VDHATQGDLCRRLWADPLSPNSGTKKAPQDGAFHGSPQPLSDGGGGVESWLRSGAVPVLGEDFRRRFLAGAAAAGHAEFCLQAPQIDGASLSGLPYLLVGYRIADADIHEINQLPCFQLLKRK